MAIGAHQFPVRKVTNAPCDAGSAVDRITKFPQRPRHELKGRRQIRVFVSQFLLGAPRQTIQLDDGLREQCLKLALGGGYTQRSGILYDD